MECKLIDSMGDDVRVAEAARVSFHKDIPDKILRDQDVKLIKYLAKHNHFTPFTHVMITMKEKVPIFVARQRFKHTVGFSYNEVSRRYVDDPPEFYVPEVWRGKPVNAKQGSSDTVVTELVYDDHDIGDRIPISPRYELFLQNCEDFYHQMIVSGVAPEQARMVLPQSMYTEYYVTGSLAAWARAYKLRIDTHAQKEIRDLADLWDEVFVVKLPQMLESWKALTG